MIENTHYTVNESTQHITFNKEIRLYRIEKSVFSSHNLDIDAIRTFGEYSFFKNEYRYEITAALVEHWQNRHPKTEDEIELKKTMMDSMTLRQRLQKNRGKTKHPYLRVIK